MRIAVLGATGNVGQALLSELQQAGHEVIGIARHELRTAQGQRSATTTGSGHGSRP